MQLARARFKNAEDADRKQRQRELDDCRFYGGDQWDPAVRKSRLGTPGDSNRGEPPTPARPTLTINKTRAPVRQVLNEERQLDLGVEITPIDDFGDLATSQVITPEEIKLREGLVRRIQRDSNAVDARSWAFARAVVAGRGYYGVMTRYLKGKTFDQEVCLHRFYNQACVSLDPLHEEPDGSDAGWGMVWAMMYWDTYKKRWPKIASGQRNMLVYSNSDQAFRALGDEAPEWFSTADGPNKVKMVRVADYWYTIEKPRELALLKDGSVEWLDAVPKKLRDAIDDSRIVIEKTVMWAKIDGIQKLEETQWNGPDIPIVKVLGEELQPYDQERRSEGMVRPARDSNIGFNAMISQEVEQVALAPRPPWIMANGQDEGFEAEWAASATRTLATLHYNPVTFNGEPVPPPSRTAVETPIQAIAFAIKMFDEGIQATMGVGDPTLGITDPSLRSGKAVKALQQQSQHGTSNFIDNLKRSLRYEGQVINGLLYPIYGRPGRIAKILDPQGKTQQVMLHRPMVQSGSGPVAAPPGHPQAVTYTLTEGADFDVVIKAVRSYDSRRQEQADTLGELISENPAFAAIFGDLWIAAQDWPGHEEAAERMKAMLAPPIQQMIAQKDAGTVVPPPVQAKLNQLQQQNGQLTQALTEATEMVKSKKAELDSKERVAQLDRDKDIELRKMSDATAIAVARIQLSAKGIMASAEAQEEAIALAQSQHADLSTLAAEQQHEHDLQLSSQAHEAALGDQQHAQGLEAAQQGQDHALEQGQQAAALAPEPQAPTEGT